MSGILALACALMGQPATDDRRPDRVEADWSDASVHLRVIGRSATNVRVRYHLLAIDGSNRADQSGGATLDGGGDVLLLDLSQNAGTGWSAVLDVTGEGVAPYRIAIRRP